MKNLFAALLFSFFITTCLSFEASSIGHQLEIPYTELSEATYSSDFNVYHQGTFDIKIINRFPIEKMTVEISKSSAIIPNELQVNPLPWWSDLTPRSLGEILKKLDFSKVDGKERIYLIGSNYRLVQLSHQGAWGVVYVLERLSHNMLLPNEPLCAIKVLLTRPSKQMSVDVFRKRHQEEIKNMQHATQFEISIKPYGIIKNDDDHYLIFMEYGSDVRKTFSGKSINTWAGIINKFIKEVTLFHNLGFSHGDLKLDNMLLSNGSMKLCDWFSLIDFRKTTLKDYRYDGDNLPPESIRAFYFKQDPQLQYAVIKENGENKAYWLHPIAADRFSLGVSLLEIVAPDLYGNFDKIFTKTFNPYQPGNLDFWPKYVQIINETHKELLERAEKIDNEEVRLLFNHIASFIQVDPLARI